MTLKSRVEQPPRSVLSRKWTILLCVGCFCAGMLFTSRMWTVHVSKSITKTTSIEAEKLKLVSEGCNSKTLDSKVVKRESKDILGEVSKTHHAIRTLNKTISNLEMELAAAKAAQESVLSGSPLSQDLKKTDSSVKRRYFMVVGINTAFSSRRRRDSVRATWMPQASWIEIDQLL